MGSRPICPEPWTCASCTAAPNNLCACCNAVASCCLTEQPASTGNNEQQQLDYIFKLMGAPSEENWPGVSGLEL